MINTFCHIVTERLECNDRMEYDILFLLCSCNQLTKSERKKVQRKHKSTTQKRLLDDKRKDEYANLEPVQKKIMLEKAALNYNKMDPMKRNVLLETNKQKYKLTDPIKKKVLLDSQTKKYRVSMDLVHDLDDDIN